jgi:hypothetical protein
MFFDPEYRIEEANLQPFPTLTQPTMRPLQRKSLDSGSNLNMEIIYLKT